PKPRSVPRPQIDRRHFLHGRGTVAPVAGQSAGASVSCRSGYTAPSAGEGSRVETVDAVRANKVAVWRMVNEGFNANCPEIADELCAENFVNTMSMVA